MESLLVSKFAVCGCSSFQEFMPRGGKRGPTRAPFRQPRSKSGKCKKIPTRSIKSSRDLERVSLLDTKDENFADDIDPKQVKKWLSKVVEHANYRKIPYKRAMEDIDDTNKLRKKRTGSS